MTSTAGFRAINNHGSVTIDQDYINYGHIQTVDVSCSIQSDTGVWRGDITVDVTSYVALFQHELAIMAVSRTGNTYTYRVFKFGSPGVVQVHVFGPAKVSNSKYGMRVFDASGAVAFDALIPYARVIDFIVSPNLGMTGGGTGVIGERREYPAASRIAVVQCTNYFSSIDDSMASETDRMYIEYAGTTTVGENYVQFNAKQVFVVNYNGSQRYKERYSGVPTYMILDIGNIK